MKIKKEIRVLITDDHAIVREGLRALIETEAGMALAGEASDGFEAVKMARGVPHTHAAKSRLTLEGLARWTLETTGDAKLAHRVGGANTARHAFDMLWPDSPEVVHRVGRGMLTAARGFAGSELGISGVIFGFDGALVFNSDPDLL